MPDPCAAPEEVERRQRIGVGPHGSLNVAYYSDGHFVVEPPEDADDDEICDVCGTYLPLMGSHYHCGHCQGVTGMMGHYTNLKREDGSTVFSCDDDYEEIKRASSD